MGLVDCKSSIIFILTSIIAFYVIRDYKNQRKNLHDLRHTSITPQKANQKLIDHNKIWNNTEELIKVTDGVYVGVGFSLANIIILESDHSLIIIDTTESVDSALAIRAAFNESTSPSIHNKPISTIIYTHFHPDHTNGAQAFIDDPLNPPTIYSHPQTLEQLTRIFSISSSINNVRSTRQFGTLLHKMDKQNANKSSTSKLFENSGIGPYLKFGDEFDGYITLPSKLLNPDYTHLLIDNLNIDIYFAPGETPDQIFIYLPDKRILLPADNIYEAFPNIYAIRGSPTRNARKWMWSLDKMRALQPAPIILIPCHTQPVYGEDVIKHLLQDYRDGIAYIHDQTVRWLNRGLTPNQIIPLIHKYMPDRLKNHPYLQEFYGTIDWSIRGIFHSYLGWFSGDAVDLFPLSDIQIGDNLIQLMNGNINKLMIESQRYIDNNEGNRDSCQWGLRIATQVQYYLQSIAVNGLKDNKYSIEDVNKWIAVFRSLRIDGLNCMASFMTSANGRNYYLTQAIESEMIDGSFLPSKKRVDWAIQQVVVDQMMSMQTVRLKIEEMDKHWKNVKICYDFFEKWYQFVIRDGIGEIKRGYSEKYLLEKQTKQMNVADIVHDIMVDMAYIVFNVSKEECHQTSDYVMQLTVQDFKDSITELKTSSAILYAKGRMKILKGTVLDFTNWKSLLELQ